MSKSTAWERGLLGLVLNNTNFAGVGDATGLRGSTTAGALYASLHTADPADAGTQSSNEISYTGYARVAIARDGTAWTINATEGEAYLNADAVFGSMTAGTGGTVTHFAIGTAASGTGVLLYKGTYTPNLAVAVGVQPKLLGNGTNTQTRITED